MVKERLVGILSLRFNSSAGRKYLHFLVPNKKIRPLLNFEIIFPSFLNTILSTFFRPQLKP